MPRNAYWLVLAALLLCTAAAWGQSQNGSLSGQVTDQSGAAVPQATVTLNSTERHIPQTVTTDSDGRYSFPSNPPGTYDLTIDAKGFKTYVKTGIELAVNQAVRADFFAKLGQAYTGRLRCFVDAVRDTVFHVTLCSSDALW